MSVRWEQLEHAYGPADDLPELLSRIPKARGRRLDDLGGELVSRVLHQGSIYNASPAVAQWVTGELPGAGGEDRRFYYGLLGGFAESARDACAGGCCGDPADGEALRQVLVSLQQSALADLTSRDLEIRQGAAHVAGAFPEENREVMEALRQRYFAEPEEEIRGALLDALVRGRTAVRDWSGFLRDAAAKETGVHNRLEISCAQVVERGATAGEDLLEALVAHLAAARQSGRFFEAVGALGDRRAADVMLAALARVDDDEILLSLAEQLLRQIFKDQRRGWGARSYSRLEPDGTPAPAPGFAKMALWAVGSLVLMKALPWVFRWKVQRQMRRAAERPGIRQIEIWGLSGLAPRLPDELEPRQREVLDALAACDGLWRFRTNLWELFGLPAERAGFRTWLQGHRG